MRVCLRVFLKLPFLYSRRHSISNNIAEKESEHHFSEILTEEKTTGLFFQICNLPFFSFFPQKSPSSAVRPGALTTVPAPEAPGRPPGRPPQGSSGASAARANPMPSGEEGSAVGRPKLRRLDGSTYSNAWGLCCLIQARTVESTGTGATWRPPLARRADTWK